MKNAEYNNLKIDAYSNSKKAPEFSLQTNSDLHRSREKLK